MLKRFPMEAEVPPGFRVMDDAAAAAVAAAARRNVAHHVLNVPGELADAYGRLSVSLDFRRFQAMFAEFENRRGALATFFDREGGLEGAKGWVWRAVDIPPDTDPEALAAEAMARLDRHMYRRAAEVLQPGGKTDAQRAATLIALAADPNPSLDDAADLFFTKDDEPRKWVETAKRLQTEPGVRAFLLEEQERLHNLRQRMRAAQVGRDSIDAISLAHAYLHAYRIEKEASGALDFADLVEKTCALLQDDAAAWVLYKLDGGVDHILLDEAQDTAPEQWAIIDALTDDFFSGAGRPRKARDLARGVFVVGDRKQSIYSFQGARPELLADKFLFYRERAAGAGHPVKRDRSAAILAFDAPGAGVRGRRVHAGPPGRSGPAWRCGRSRGGAPAAGTPRLCRRLGHGGRSQGPGARRLGRPAGPGIRGQRQPPPSPGGSRPRSTA